MFDVFIQSIEAGGSIMIVLTILCLVTWFSIGDRAYRLSAFNQRQLGAQARMIKRGSEGWTPKQEQLAGEAFLTGVKLKLLTRESLLDACVLASPLLGLLGTITGMIETFEAMAVSTSSAPADAMSSGISKAMLTTQVGLLVSLPGLLIAQALKSKKRRFLRSMESMLLDPHERNLLNSSSQNLRGHAP